MTTFDRFFARLTLPRALALAALLWALIYLPVLGSLEIKGEEGRRILPAVTMLDSGDWLVPQVGGVPYYSKPPLINWLVAKSFQWTGNRNEWSARLPSVLAMLALALTAVWSLVRWLGVGGGLLCAIFLLTNIGLMEKGRLIEIEAVYLSLFGIALLLWMREWRRDADQPALPRFPWRAWTLPHLFLGLGLLTKGPLHLVYFYAVVLGILLCAGRWRDAFNRAHLLGIVLMLGIFATWAVPYFREINVGQATGRWYSQMAGRAEVSEKFRLSAWLLNGPRGLVNFLPWVVLLPLAWRLRASKVSAGAMSQEVDGDLRTPWQSTAAQPPNILLDAAVVRGLGWSLALCFVIISLAPGGIPRYTLPLLVPASILLALAFANCRTTVLVAESGNVENALAVEDARSNQRVSLRQWGPSPYNPDLPAALPLVWTRVLAICLALAVLAAPVAAFQGGRGSWRWLTALAVVTFGTYLLRRVNRLRQFAENPSAPIPPVLPLALASGVVMALLTADYAVGAVHRLHRAESVRPVGLAVRHVVPADQPVAVLEPGFLPFLFYVDNLRYLQTVESFPPAVHYLLVRQRDLPTASATLKQQGYAPRVLLGTKDKRIADAERGTWLLLGLDRAGLPSL